METISGILVDVMSQTESSIRKVAGIVFAAGSSRRMGRNKALLELHGTTFLEVIVRNMRKAGIDPITIVGCKDLEQIIRRTGFPRDMFVVDCTSNFVRTGLENILIRGEVCGLVLCPVDVPTIRSESFRLLSVCGLSSHASIVLFRYGLRIAGTVVYVSKSFLPWAMRLSSMFFKSSLSSFLALCATVTFLVLSGQCRLRFLPTKDHGVLEDIDTPLNYARMRERAERNGIKG